MNPESSVIIKSIVIIEAFLAVIVKVDTHSIRR